MSISEHFKQAQELFPKAISEGHDPSREEGAGIVLVSSDLAELDPAPETSDNENPNDANDAPLSAAILRYPANAARARIRTYIRKLKKLGEIRTLVDCSRE